MMVAGKIENLYKYIKKHFPEKRLFGFLNHQKAKLKENQMLVILYDYSTKEKTEYIVTFNEKNYPISFKRRNNE